MKTKQQTTARTIARLHGDKGQDHRVWKQLLCLCGEAIRTNGTGLRTDPCMTTAVDAAARRACRSYTPTNA